MIQVSREEFALFLQGRELEGKPVHEDGLFNPMPRSTMQFVDKEGIVHAQAIYTAVHGEKVSVRYEIRRVK